MKIYMAVTADEYELPLCVCENPRDLAEWAGLTVGSVQSAISLRKTHSRKYINFVRVEVEEDEDGRKNH